MNHTTLSIGLGEKTAPIITGGCAAPQSVMRKAIPIGGLELSPTSPSANGRRRRCECIGREVQDALRRGAEGILVADVESKQFKYGNPAICRMLGYTAEELTRLSLADIHPKEALDYVVAEFEAQARGEKIMSS